MKVGKIGYGSILHPEYTDELADAADGIPVRVDGVERHCMLESSYRPPLDELGGDADTYRGVLDIAEGDGAMNGILFEPDTGEAAALDDREAQYGDYVIPAAEVAERVTPYSDDPAVQEELAAFDQIELYIGEKTTTPGIHPHPRYIVECIEGARRWDMDAPGFRDDFLAETVVSGGDSLASWLDAHEDLVMRYVERPADVGSWGVQEWFDYDGAVTVARDPFIDYRKARNAAGLEPVSDSDLMTELAETEWETVEERLGVSTAFA